MTELSQLRIPDIDHRKRVPLRAIRAVAKIIAEKFDPEKIILFGSHAYGHPKPWSDVDLLVVMETELTRREQKRAISRLFYHRPFSLDIKVRTPADLAWRLEQGDFFLREVVRKGKVLYERPDSGVGQKG